MTLPRRFAAWVLLAGVALDWGAAVAQPQNRRMVPDEASRAEKRFPQPVRVGDLIGRQVLRPVEQQDVLGRVAALVRRPDGAILVVVSLGGVLGLNTRPVAVPVGAMALLGQYMEVLDLSPAQLRALPTFDDPGAPRLAPDEIIRVGLQRPPH